MMTVENTDPNCAWLTNAVESLLTHVWYPSTVATLSHNVKGMIRQYLRKTGSDAGLNFMLHDFGYRGVSSDESAAIGGAAHLINFMGTDTVIAMLLLQDFYKVWDTDTNSDTFKDIAYSVPATEHSIMTSLGKKGENNLVGQLIEDHPKGILSVVADSYDIYNFVSVIMGVHQKEKILARDGVFVVRPDSVTPTHDTPETQVLWIVNALFSIFGGTTNDKGYTVINPKVRVLWGDGIDPDGIEKILALLETHKFAAENMACFGMGGGLLQKVNRDTQRFAFKCSYQERDGVGYDIWKQPLDKSKASKKGQLKLVLQEGSHANVLVTVPITDPRPDFMQTVFLNGNLEKTYSLTQVRSNANEIYPPYPRL
jgi:nicotinamide phosphoribosyltransferase